MVTPEKENKTNLLDLRPKHTPKQAPIRDAQMAKVAPSTIHTCLQTEINETTIFVR